MDKQQLLDLEANADLTVRELRTEHPDLAAPFLPRLESRAGDAVTWVVDRSPRLRALAREVTIPIDLDSSDRSVREATLAALRDHIRSDPELSRDATLSAELADVAVAEPVEPTAVDVGELTVADSLSLDEPVTFHPDFADELRSARIHRLVDTSALGDDVATVLIEDVGDLRAISDERLAGLVDAGRLDRDQAHDVGKLASVHALVDERTELAGSLAAVVEHTHELARLDVPAWAKLLDEHEVRPPGGLSRGDYARLLVQKMDRLFPATALAERLRHVAATAQVPPNATVARLRNVLPDHDITGGTAELPAHVAIDAAAADSTLAGSHDALSESFRVRNLFPGQGLGRLLFTTDAPAAERRKQVREQAEAFSSFLDANPGVFAKDLTAGSPDLASLVFPDDVDDAQRSGLVATTRAFDRMLGVTDDLAQTLKLVGSGYASAVSIAQTPIEEFALRSSLTAEESQLIHAKATDTAMRVLANLGVVFEHIVGLSPGTLVDNADPQIREFFQAVPGYADLFGSQSRCACSHCQSILGPAAYFVDVMEFIDAYVTKRRFDTKPNHPLALRVRRPDLWTLELTCANTNTPIAYLEIINEVLGRAVAAASAFTGDLANAEAVAAHVFGTVLPTAVNGFSQPFNLAFEELSAYVSLTKHSLADLAEAALASATPLTRLRLGLAPEPYGWVVKTRDSLSALRSLYGIDLVEVGTGIAPVQTKELLRATGLTRTELQELVGTWFVTSGGAASVRLVGEKLDPQSVQNDVERVHGLTRAVLDRMHRFVRLWRAGDWRMPELDLLLRQAGLVGTTAGINADSLAVLARLRRIQETWRLPVDELAALWSPIPTTPVPPPAVPEPTTAEGDPLPFPRPGTAPPPRSLFDRLFNPVDLLGTVGSYPQPTVAFLHPALGTPSATSEAHVSRLLAATGTTPDGLYQLILGLAAGLGVDPSSTQDSDKDFPLDAANLTLLYRHARLARLLKVDVVELFALIAMTPEIPGDRIAGLDDLEALLRTRAWQQDSGRSIAGTLALTGGSLPTGLELRDAEPAPDDLETARALVDGVARIGALTFADTQLAAVAPLPPVLISAAALTSTAAGNTVTIGIARDALVEPDERIVFGNNATLGEIVDDWNSKAVATLAYRATTDGRESAGGSRLGITLREGGGPTTTLTVESDTAHVFPASPATYAGQALSDVDSRGVIAANAARLEMVSPGVYRLAAGYDLTTPPVLPASVPAAFGPRVAEFFAQHHSRAVLEAGLPGLLADPPAVVRALLALLGPDLDDPAYLAELRNDQAPTRIAALLSRLRRLGKALVRPGRDEEAVALAGLVSASPAQFGVSDFDHVGLRALQRLAVVRDLLARGEPMADQAARLTTLLTSFTTTGGLAASMRATLAAALDHDLALVGSVSDAVPIAASAPEHLARLDLAIRLVSDLGTSGSVLSDCVDTSYARIAAAAAAIQHGGRSRAGTDERWERICQPVVERLRSRRRDGLVAYLLRSAPDRFADTAALYDYYLLDVELEGCMVTSRVASAIDTVQLYVQRCLMNLEQSPAGDDDPVRVLPQDIPLAEWEGRKSYRIWELGRRIYLAPHRVLESGLRDDTTHLFRQLESELLSKEVTEETILAAYSRYLRGFDELSHLSIAGSYHEKDTDAQRDVLHLLGATAGDAPVYYYRRIENAHYGVSNAARPTDWGAWEPLDIQIPVSKVSPVVYQGQLHVFWIRYTTAPLNTLRNGESVFSGYQHRSYVEYTRRRLDGTWTPPQRIRLTEAPFDARGDGVILDPIVPKSQGLQPILWFTIPIYRDFQPMYDAQVHEVPKSDYSLRGFRWDQLFAASSPTGVSIRGADFQMWSRVDFYRQRIGQRIDDLHPQGDGLPWLSPGLFLAIWLLSLGKFDLTRLLPPRLVWSRLTTLTGSQKKVRTLHSVPPGVPCFDTYTFASLLLDEQRFLQYTNPPHALTTKPQWPTTVTGLLKGLLVEHRIADAPASSDLAVVNGSVGDVIIETDSDVLYLQEGARSDGRYLLRRLRTTVSSDIASVLFSSGIDKLLDPATQMSLREHPTSVALTPDVVDATDTGRIDFRGATGVYFREIFFHIPVLIANYFNSQGQYEQADRWYRYVFDPTAGEEPRTDVSAVAAAQEGNGRLHLLQLAAGGRMEYAALRGDGFWETVRLDVASVTSDPGPFSGVSAAVDGQGTLHVVGVTTDGRLWHTLRSASGVWQSAFGDVKAATGSDPGPIAGAACTMQGQALHVLARTSDGKVWLATRAGDAGWTPFTDVNAQIGDPGVAVSIGCACDAANDLHVCIATDSGYLWHTLRHPSGSWQGAGWGNVTTSVNGPSGATGVACASYGTNSVHIVARTSDAGLWHIVRHPASWDTPFADLRTVAGQRGLAGQPATCVDGEGRLTVMAPLGGATWSAERLADGVWRSMHPAGVNDRDRPWRYREFRNLSVPSLRQVLTDTGAISRYRRDPFNPHAIARTRLTAYMKWVTLKVADNHMDAGDELFQLAFSRRNPEYLRQAMLKYVMAQKIIGPRSDPIGDCGQGPASGRTFPAIQQARLAGSEFLMEYESIVLNQQWGVLATTPTSLMPVSAALTAEVTGRLYAESSSMRSNAASAPPPDTEAIAKWEDLSPEVKRQVTELSNADVALLSTTDAGPVSAVPITYTWRYFDQLKPFAFAMVKEIHPIFCIPVDADVDEYRDRVEDRLYKLRHCMDIDGVPRQLPLFAPPIDLTAFLAGRAAGLGGDDVLVGGGPEVPPFRFTYLVEKAKAYADEVQKLGTSLLGAFDRKEAEELARIRDRHEKNVLALTTAVRDDELAAAREAVLVAQNSLAVAQYRRDYFGRLISSGLSGAEITHEVAMATAAVMRTGSAIFDTIAAIAHLVPEVGSPFSMKYGGKQVALSSSAWSMLGNRLADVADATSTISGTRATFERREQDWRHQEELAKREVDRARHDLDAAEVRVRLAERALDIHRRSVEQNQEVLDFYDGKFTSVGQFTRLSKSLQKLLREGYLEAHGLGAMVEQVYHWERPDDPTRYIGGEWDPSRSGLNAGEQLKLELLRMERRYLETVPTDDEITQHFNLQQLDPEALVTLRQTGRCEFDVPEIAYDLIYPGQYRRRIKNVRLTMTCLGGSYTNVGARLVQLGSFIRTRPVIDDAALAQVPPSRTQTVAVSTAKGDGGVFEFSFGGERTMPFEGSGAVSRWRIRLPAHVRAFDYESISEVVLHVSFTASYDEAFADVIDAPLTGAAGSVRHFLANNPLVRVFSLHDEFPAEFRRLVRSAPGTAVDLQLTDVHFPLLVAGRKLVPVDTRIAVNVTDRTRDVGTLAFKLGGKTTQTFVDGTATPDPTAEFGGLPTAALSSSLSGPLIGSHAISVTDPGSLAPTDPGGALDDGLVSDVLIAVSYLSTDP